MSVHIRRFLRLAIAAGLVAAIAPIGAEAASEAGSVLTLRGDCAATTAGSRHNLATGATVYVADVIDIAADARLKLKMADGSILAMAGGTQMTITAYGTNQGGENRDVELDLAGGLMRAIVSKVTAPSRFEVDTAAGVAAVRGTDWFINAGAQSTQVGVLAGKVTLSSKATKHAVDIPAHWGARLQAGMDPVPPRRWQQREFDDVISRTNVD